MLEFANFLSVLPLYYIIFTIIILIYCFLVQNNFWKNILIYFVGLMIALFLPAFIKYLTHILKIENLLFYRPKGAKGCDFLSTKGFAPPFTPGFPSGHMTITAFVMVFNILLIINNRINYVQKCLIIFLNLIFIILMSWARHFKKCHNIFQIIGGILLGIIIAKLTFDMLKN